MIIGFDGSRAFGKVEPSSHGGDHGRTGTENYSYQLLLHLAKVDKDNSYIVYLRPGSIVNTQDWPANFGFKILNYPKLWTQVGLALETFRAPLDVLFVPAHTLPLIRRPDLKTVMTVHDLGVEYLPKMHQLKQRLYLGFITKVQLKGATRLIAVSKATKQDLVKKVGIDPQKIEVVYEAVNTNIFKPINDIALRNILKQFDLVKNNYFLFVGTIQPRKNLERLIKAFASLAAGPGSFKLILAGSKGWLSDNIYKLPQKLGIEEKVKFLGRVNDQELSALLTGATGLVYPSLFEGFGLPILEAFACNCPVLTSNISSMPEVGEEAVLYVNPYDTDSIAEGMKKLLSVDRKAYSKKGQEQLKKFSWEKSARQTLKVLEKAGKMNG